MKNKLVKLILFASCMLIFSGCGSKDNEKENVETVSPQAESDTESGQEDNAIKDYELKYAAGKFAIEDYKTLAQLYSEADMRKKQRDILEECYRLYDDQECLNILQGITVNIAEENDTIQEEAGRLLSNMQTPGYLDEAAGMLISRDWTDVMMPVLKEGSRRYYLADQDGQPQLYVEAGIDQAGAPYSTVWYLDAEGKVQCLTQSAGTIQMLETGIADGHYQGAFEMWLCLADSGDVYHETGTFEQGVCVGDYTAQVRYGTEAADLFALWCSRENMTMTDYQGSFNDAGESAVNLADGEQINITNGGNGNENFVVYAATEDKSKYLFMNVPDDTGKDSFVFDYTVFGIAACPQVEVYEPKQDTAASETEKMITSREVQIRVYDDRIQWFDGSIWHTLGDVAEYVEQDPFRAYQERQTPEENEQQEESRWEIYQNRGSAAVKKASSDQPSKPSKKADNKTGNKAAAPSPTPTAPAAPATPQKPAAPSGNTGGSDNSGGSGGSSGGSSGGGSSSGGNSGGGGDSSGGSGGSSGGGSESGGSDSGGSGSSGGDVDIEWTDDIL